MKKELLALFLAFFIVLTAVSLFSYNAADPCAGNGFLTRPDTIHNTFGLLGGHVAGLLILCFGIGAFWVPVILCAVSVWLLQGRDKKIIWLTLLGGLLLMVGSGAFLYLFRDDYHLLDTTIRAGGVVGQMVTVVLLRYTNVGGAIIFIIFFMVLGFVLATGISVFSLLRFIREKSIRGLTIMADDARSFIDAASRESQAFLERRAQKRKEKEEARQQANAEALAAEAAGSAAGSDEAEKPEKKTDGKATPAKAGRTGGDPGISAPGASEPEQAKKTAAPVPEKENTDFPPIRTREADSPAVLELEPEDAVVIDEEKFKDIREKKTFSLPRLSFLEKARPVRQGIDTGHLQEKSRLLEDKLNDFNVFGEVTEILPGPVITTFEYRPAPGIKISKIAGLSDDLALALCALSIRVVGPIPGRDVVGIEIPNDEREIVRLHELISSRDFTTSPSLLTLALGKDLLGRPVVTKMDSMPHLLIAGATGTGKSVGLNAMITSLLYKGSPDDIKMIMIDPKRIELSVYNDIPHLISPVVTDMKKATNALFWAVREMDRRYELLEQTGLRNIIQYNKMVADPKKSKAAMEKTGLDLEKLPYIVVIVDEFADLIMVATKDVEFALQRLSQMARAAGIHLILATQRPSANVLTGNIKGNFPTRISFQVSAKVDGRIILDESGAESLLGNGDMLFKPPGTGKLVRIQGAFVSEDEIARITSFLREQRAPDYIEEITMTGQEDGEKEFDESDYDEKYDEAVALVTESRQASISYVQRRMRIGYNRAARLVEMMEHEGIVGPQIGSKPREILVKSYDDH